MSWRPRPNPGDMRLCADCRHRRDDQRKDYRCALTRHRPYLPPLVDRAGGRDVCSMFASAAAPDIAGEQMELEEA